MADKHDDGGGAFAVPCGTAEMHSNRSQDGMTLLDYFAGQALVGILACEQSHPSLKQTSCFDLTDASYDLAACMITEKRRRESA